MHAPIHPRLAATCGALFAVILFVAAGDGKEAYLAPRAIAGLAALTLFIPFLAYLCSLLRAAEGPNGWLGSTALAAGITGITLKIASVIPALALHRSHVAEGTTLHKLFDGVDNAVFCAATAMVALRTAVLPRRLGAGAAVTAAALAVNGAFLETSFVPALLLFVVWTLITSLHLLRKTWREPARVAQAQTAGG
jgi:hypothetical protein